MTSDYASAYIYIYIYDYEIMGLEMDDNAMFSLAPAPHVSWASTTVNCVAPMFVSHCLSVLSPKLHCQTLGVDEEPFSLVCYPNSGENWDDVERKWVGDAAWKSELVYEWQKVGAQVIGGCCRTSPKTIQVLRTQLVDNTRSSSS